MDKTTGASNLKAKNIRWLTFLFIILSMISHRVGNFDNF